MLNLSTLFGVLLGLATYPWLQAQDPPSAQERIQEEAQQVGSAFPSSNDLRPKISIRLVRHGCYGSCAQYSVTVFGTGAVIYEGADFARVKSRAKEVIPDEAVDDLIRKVNDMHFFSFQPQKFRLCATDGPTASVIVREPGRERQIDDECVDSKELEELEKTVDNLVAIQQWVFINAAELQKQIDHGWDITIHGREYARLAIEWDDPQVIQVLVRNGLPVDTRNEDGETLLMQAVLRNRYKSVKVLLEIGANPKTRAFYGWSPSQNAGYRSIAMCKLFLTHGAGLNDQDGMGQTMLMNATDSGNLDIVKFLVDSGAALNVRNQDGETAVGVAKRMIHESQETMSRTDYPALQGSLKVLLESARAGAVARLHQHELVIEYLRQHGGAE